ncbi:hypothetical protein CCHR01_14528 [Colletotrichum chrysophilum]|uniref:Secreted protein n=1 Tax=Colletotrichum chrysophilum TaxID=1836956 RepID=A0AAD9A9F2_9PEZI|nr:hypothetical protein CCHR01_14528 [Colletotrichum chrysophilum]
MKIITATALSLMITRILGQESSIPGYGVDEIEWEVETAPGAGFVSVNGTIENVGAEVTKINPNFREDYGLDNGTLSEVIAASSSHEKRQAIVREFSHECFGKWGPADRGRVREGIEYLYRVNGRPKNGPGPGNCGRVSCSDFAAIWWCNDAPVTKELVSFSEAIGVRWNVYGSAQTQRLVDFALETTPWIVATKFDW